MEFRILGFMYFSLPVDMLSGGKGILRFLHSIISLSPSSSSAAHMDIQWTSGMFSPLSLFRSFWPFDQTVHFLSFNREREGKRLYDESSGWTRIHPLLLQHRLHRHTHSLTPLNDANALFAPTRDQRFKQNGMIQASTVQAGKEDLSLAEQLHSEHSEVRECVYDVRMIVVFLNFISPTFHSAACLSLSLLPVHHLENHLKVTHTPFSNCDVLYLQGFSFILIPQFIITFQETLRILTWHTH